MCYSKTNLSPNYELLSVFSSRICSNTSLLMLRGLSYQGLWNLFLPWAFACRSGIVFCCMYKLVLPHLLMFPPVPPQFRLWAFLYWVPTCHYPDMYGSVTVATASVFTSVVTFVDWMLLTISHTWHLLIGHVSSLDACQITTALPFTSKVFPISTTYSSPHLAHLPWGSTLNLLPDSISLSSCSTWSLTEAEATVPFLFGHISGVHQKPFTHFTVLSVCVLPLGVHRSILGTEVLYTNIGQ